MYQNHLNHKHQSVVKTFIYFDIFNYPLKLNEVIKFCSIKINTLELERLISDLIINNIISFKNEFYFLTGNNESIIGKRYDNEQRAKKIERKVKRYSKIISSFPFVEAVCISGSFSKGVLDLDGDIDYFIITKPDRLWLSRTLLILFKKIFLFNSKKYFCVNYFIDTNTLVTPDKNIYTATEVSTLIPVNNIKLFTDFVNANKWVYDQFPNLKEVRKSAYFDNKKRVFTQIFEKILSGKIGTKLDNYFFKITVKTWQKRFPDFNTIDFELNMRSKKSVSKHHPQGFQAKVLNEVESRFKKYNF